MTDLYVTPAAFDEGTLHTADGHRLHYYQFGRPDGVPLLFSHGGPGEGVKPDELRIFDPAYFRIIALDQRGCGKSAPHLAADPAAALAGNNPAQLVADFEALRQQLQIETWHLRGNSWGSTLSLLYAIAHPAHVRSLLLSGIYLNRTSDRQWYEDRLPLVYPQLMAQIEPWLSKPLQESHARIEAIATALDSFMLDEHLRKAAIIQAIWDQAATYFQVQVPEYPEGENKRRDHLALGGLAAFYIARQPLPEDWYRDTAATAALAQIRRIHVLSGQYDMATPLGYAYSLQKAHPHSQLQIVPDGGHVTGEPAMATALLAAAEGLKAL